MCQTTYTCLHLIYMQIFSGRPKYFHTMVCLWIVELWILLKHYTLQFECIKKSNHNSCNKIISYSVVSSVPKTLFICCDSFGEICGKPWICWIHMYALQNKQPIMKSSSCIDWQPHLYDDRSSEKLNAHQVLPGFFEIFRNPFPHQKMNYHTLCSVK